MRSRKDAGFTLMETLVAFAIFSLSVTAILQSYSTSSRAQARAQANIEASNELAQLLATVEARLDRPGSAEGTTSSGYDWTLAAEEAGDNMIVIRAAIRDPFGRVQSATTMRWKGEVFPERSR